MPLYIIERHYAEQMEPHADGIRLIEQANADAGVQWIYSFLTADRMQSYCLYEAPSPEALITAAHAAGLPADVIVEVSRVSADAFL